MQSSVSSLIKDDLTSQLRTAFGLQGETVFDPHSIWFSYGSNLDKGYFDEKMRGYDSNLTIIEPRNAVLSDFERMLDNKSQRHALGYEIHFRAGITVEGMLHKVPRDNLEEFLGMEGVLDENFTIRGLPSYWMVGVGTQSEGVRVQALTLVGNKRCTVARREQEARDNPVELKKYIEASMSGASTRGIESARAQFVTDLDWFNSLLDSSKAKQA
jgi:hypothetical protein